MSGRIGLITYNTNHLKTEQILSRLAGKYDLAALPVNVAAKLYNMPDVEVQVVALNTLGVLLPRLPLTCAPPMVSRLFW